MRDGEKRVSNLQKIIFLLIIKTRGRTAMKIKPANKKSRLN